MAKCPKCGVEVEEPTKTWTLAPKGKKPVTIGLFKCQTGHVFRAGVKSEIKEEKGLEEEEREKGKKKWYEFWK